MTNNDRSIQKIREEFTKFEKTMEELRLLKNVAEDLKNYRADVAIGPEIITYDKGKPVNNADILARSGLRVAFHTSATSGTQYLPVNAAYAVRHGMDPDKAFRAVTSYPAQMLNVDDRIGSIDVGKDADLVILSGEPFDFATRSRR